MARNNRQRPARRQGFPPVAGRNACILVLGSMPGEASLAAGQYYAFRHNQFWRIAGEICGFAPDAPYGRRKAALKRSRIALWDVLASCVRPGSLDSAIREDSIRVNDFAGFLAAHPGIRRVCFNGRKAEHAWRRRVLPALPAARKLEYRLLPSTSPAHAGMGYLAKLEAWRSAIRC
ncbi:MAG TPA: DNA-deoxyinosine glycosylase [Steroidobacteraceae bacterium]|nr:DNA-deoxyinosine glycosylase [Steroidobacteraceae bacterium]